MTRSPMPMSHALQGVDFPAGRDDLVRHARAQGAAAAVIAVLERLPEEKYENLAEVMSGVVEARH